MKVTIEQVEKLQARANVSYEEAKAALEKCDGDILEALIELEKDGKTAQPNGGTYSTNQQFGENGNNSGNGNSQDSYYQNQSNNNNQGGPQMNSGQGQQNSENFKKQAGSVWRSFVNLFHKGNINHFVIAKNNEEVVRMPVNLLILLLIIFNAAAIIVLIILLFCGFKYSFEGPNLGKQSINNVMDSAHDTAEDIKKNVKEATADNSGDNSNNDGQNNNN